MATMGLFRRTVAAGAVIGASVAAFAPTVGAERPGEVDEAFVRGDGTLTEPGQAVLDFESFGRWSIGGFSHAAAVPGDGRLLTVRTSGSGGSIALLDVETGAFALGAGAPEEVRGIDVSSDGRWAYVRAFETSSAASSVVRYDVDDLSVDGTVDFGALSTFDDSHDLVTIPGRPDLALVSVGSSVAMVQDTTVLPETVSGATMPRSLVAVDATLAFGLRNGTLYRIELSSSGVTAVTAVGTNTSTEALYLVDDHVVVGREIFPIDGGARRMGSSFELARQDPTLPARYLDTSLIFDPDLGEFDPASILIDEESGAEISSASPPCFTFTADDVLIGEGLKVRAPLFGSLDVVDVPDACGSYGELTPVDPARVLDSRTGQGMASARQIGSGETIRVKIHGLAGVPETGVESVVLNVTALRQSGIGAGNNFLTVWPAGYPQPTVSNLNIGEGQIVGNMVTVSTSAGGFVDIYSDRGSVDLTVDVMGYFAGSLAPSGARFRKTDNTRILDTRSGSRLGPRGTLSVDVRNRGSGGFDYGPNDIVAAVVNVTAVQPTQGSFFAIYPSGSPLPDASSANFPASTNTNRLVTVKTNDGRFDIWNSVGSAHVTVDLVGVYVDNDQVDQALSGRFVGLVPFRDVDTRIESPFDGDGSLIEEGLISIPGWRSNLDLVTNLTAIRPTTTGFFSSGPWEGDFDPFYRTSSLNFGPGSVVANQSIIRSSVSGEIGIFNRLGRTHLAVDLFGYYTPDI